ncbi:MAG TPA: ferrous iron transport protein A [Cytophagales bacterium]|nr:ferrous iron transport protein A [Cytophagales bacterium]
MNLAQLHLGQEAIIQRIDNQEVYLKLLDLGCFPGEKIKMAFIAPLGDPMAIQVAGSTISIRKVDAETVLIKRI